MTASDECREGFIKDFEPFGESMIRMDSMAWSGYQKAWRRCAPAPAHAPGESELCTCPSGDGSLRWPCPKHPPTPRQQGKSEQDTAAYDFVCPGYLAALSDAFHCNGLSAHTKRKLSELHTLLATKQFAAAG